MRQNSTIKTRIQDEIFVRICFLLVLLTRYQGKVCWKRPCNVPEFNYRSCEKILLPAGGGMGGIPETPMANTISGCPNRSKVQMMATDVGLVVGKIPPKKNVSKHCNFILAR